MKKELYKIIACDGAELPLLNGKYRDKKQADRLLSTLNKNGEYKPYKKEKL